MIPVQVIGAAGYTGAELVRLLLRHPEFEPVSLCDKQEIKSMAEAYPHFREFEGLEITHVEGEMPIPNGIKVVFMAVPDGVAMNLALPYLSKKYCGYRPFSGFQAQG